MESDTDVRDISALRIADAEEAGGKGANMGELVIAAAERRFLVEAARGEQHGGLT